jgi:hypothetical protein
LIWSLCAAVSKALLVIVIIAATVIVTMLAPVMRSARIAIVLTARAIGEAIISLLTTGAVTVIAAVL